jgi:hypothetical protein
MNALTIPRAVAGAEYTVIRLPLSVLETRVVERYLPEESPVRLGFERALGTLDATVGRVLSNPELTRRGAALARRSDVLAKAVALEEKAAVRKQEANAGLTQAKRAAERKRVDATQRAQGVAKELHEQQKAERRAAEEKAEAAARAEVEAVEREAQAALEREQAQLEGRLTAIESRTAARTAKPQAELQDAAELRGEAARERKTAARLGQLAETEKAQRKSS